MSLENQRFHALQEVTNSLILSTIGIQLEVLKTICDDPKTRQLIENQVRSLTNGLEQLEEIKDHYSKKFSEKGQSAEAKVGRPETSLYLFEYAKEPPRKVSRAEAAQLMSISAQTLANKLSASEGAFHLYKEQRHMVLSRTDNPDDCERALRAKFNETMIESDIFYLSPRGRTANGLAKAPVRKPS